MSDSPPNPAPLARLTLVAVGLAVLAAWAHQLWLVDWVVDDAAISMAYARNLVDGEGLVATPGGERVEGYSNPLWVLLLAMFEGVGIGGMLSAKLMALGFSALSVWLSWRVASRLIPGRLEALAAPFFLAISAQFAIWNASGLENALFTMLLLAGLSAVQISALGWAGLAFAGLALTRPEAVAYGGVVGLWVLALHRRSAWRYWAAWLAPVAAHELFRWWYFAWPLPNTYYAKLGTPFDRVGIRARGWVQLWDWASTTGVGWGLPVFAAAPFGRALPGVVALGVALGVTQLPDLWRIGLLLGLAVAGPLFAQGPPVARIAAHLAAAGLAFGVYAGGDWMRGYRWMSLVVGPLAVLFAVGLRVWVDTAVEYFGNRELTQWVAGVGILGALMNLNVPLTRDFGRQPVDYPEMIARRLAYTNAIARDLGLDRRRVSTLEMDMGAHMLWSRYGLVDLAGLVDVPIAHHGFRDRDFFEQYLFQEKRPDFAHLHRYWAKVSGLTRYPEWREGYVHVGPYDDDGVTHDGIWVRRDHLFRSSGPILAAGGGLALGELTLVHGQAGERARLRVGIHPSTEEDLEVVVRVGGVDTPVDLGWISRGQWRSETWVWGTLVDLDTSEHADRIEVLAGGEVVHSIRIPASGSEGLTPDGVRSLAAEGRCEEAESRWAAVLDAYPSRGRGEEAGVRAALSDCLARAAEPSSDLALLERAHAWDHRAADFVRVATPLADRRYQDGLDARSRADAPTAYRAFSDVLRIAPHRSWARRYAEEARLR